MSKVNTMQSRFCVGCLEEALRIYGNPEVFNSDQGSQFTSEEFTAPLRREAIKISIDGRGRVFDNIFVERFWRNVKCEDIYLNGYSTVDHFLIACAILELTLRCLLLVKPEFSYAATNILWLS